MAQHEIREWAREHDLPYFDGQISCSTAHKTFVIDSTPSSGSSALLTEHEVDGLLTITWTPSDGAPTVVLARETSPGTFMLSQPQDVNAPVDTVVRRLRSRYQRRLEQELSARMTPSKRKQVERMNTGSYVER